MPDLVTLLIARREVQEAQLTVASVFYRIQPPIPTIYNFNNLKITFRSEVRVSFGTPLQCDQKKSPNVYKSCPKMIDFDTFTKIA